jgi:hypothetical protein
MWQDRWIKFESKLHQMLVGSSVTTMYALDQTTANGEVAFAINALDT